MYLYYRWHWHMDTWCRSAQAQLRPNKWRMWLFTQITDKMINWAPAITRSCSLKECESVSDVETFMNHFLDLWLVNDHQSRALIGQNWLHDHPWRCDRECQGMWYRCQATLHPGSVMEMRFSHFQEWKLSWWENSRHSRHAPFSFCCGSCTLIGW